MFALLCIACGFFTLVAQALFIREILAVSFGNELCLGIIFASWFLGITCGAGFGVKLTGGEENRIKELCIIVILMVFLLPLEIVAVRVFRSLLFIRPGEYLSFQKLALGCLIAVTPFSFLIGLFFPFACHALSGIRKSTGRSGSGGATIGLVYVWEAVGSITGGIAFTFLFVIIFKTFQIVAISGCVFLLVLTLFGVIASKGISHLSLRVRHISLVDVAICFSLILWLIFCFYGAQRIEQFSLQKRWHDINPGMELIGSKDSKYQHIGLGKDREQFSIFGNNQYISSFPDDFEYETLAGIILSQHPHPDDILLIGGGSEGLVRWILKNNPASIDYVELDPGIFNMILPHLPELERLSLEDRRVKLNFMDGRYFVKHTAKKYDIVILNLPDPSTVMLNRFYTVDFFRELEGILSPGGVCCLGVTSTINYFREEVADYGGSVYHSLKKVFPNVVIMPGDKILFFASSEEGVVTSHVETLKERFRKRNPETKYFSEYHFDMAYPEERVRFVENKLSRQKEQLNRDERPITCYFNLIMWDRFSGSHLAGIWMALSKLKLWHILSALLIFCLIRLIYLQLDCHGHRPRNDVIATTSEAWWEAISHFKIPYNKLSPGSKPKETRFNSIWVIATTGFAGMALEIILIFAFQSIYGYVYQKIGLIVAFFMAGLAAGGYYANRLIARRKGDVAVPLIRIEGVLLLFCLLLPYMISNMSRAAIHPFITESAFFISIIFTGFITGIEFPLASQIYISAGERVGRTAGIIDALDHLGAGIGAFFTSIILVPVLGIAETCLLIVSLKLLSEVFLVTWNFKLQTKKYP